MGCMIGLFDNHKVNVVKVKHWWDDPSWSAIRSTFCEAETANGKCTVPILGGNKYDSEEEWCIELYNNTDCKGIKDEAQDKYTLASTSFYTMNGIWVLFLVVLMWVTLSVLQAIITLPI